MQLVYFYDILHLILRSTNFPLFYRKLESVIVFSFFFLIMHTIRNEYAKLTTFIILESTNPRLEEITLGLLRPLALFTFVNIFSIIKPSVPNPSTKKDLVGWNYLIYFAFMICWTLLSFIKFIIIVKRLLILCLFV